MGAFVVMPNHFHGILFFWKDGIHFVGATRRVAPSGTLQSGSLGAVIGQFKSLATKRINVFCQTPGRVIWQRNYYEHILRDQRDLDAHWHYIEANPEEWDRDLENPIKR